MKDSSMDLEITVAIRNIIMSILSLTWTTFVLGYGGYKVLKGYLSIGNLIVLVQYSSRMFSPIMTITGFVTEVKRSKASFDRIKKIINAKSTMLFPMNNLMSNSWHIKFSNVNFGYNTKKNVLKNINMDIGEGSKIAIVGESGSGKSTIVNVLQKLWPITRGEIILGKNNLSEYNEKYIRQNIGVVSQNSIFINATIKKNILWDYEDISDAKIWEILKITELYDFVNRLPNKLETLIGDKGMALSGGQKQRIEIARVLLRDTPIIILDEATSSLDNVIEKHILENIIKLYKEKTIILITHRLDKLQKFDQIYVMKNGTIVETGKHEELMKRGSEYFRLFMFKIKEKQNV